VAAAAAAEETQRSLVVVLRFALCRLAMSLGRSAFSCLLFRLYLG
jgi:hypothetical protein